MYEPSLMSTNSLATVTRKIAQIGHPKVDIRLDEHNDAAFTYTTADSLSGVVSITAPHTVRFDEVHITLEGLVHAQVVNMTPMAAHSRIDAKHPFLKLTMPIPESDYPQPRIAEAGETYRFPFNFVIPSHLLLSACRHACDGDHVREAHLHLPPSLGDRDISPSDDLTPDMAKIQYAIKVRVTRTREHDGKDIVLTERARKIRVIPAIPEAPPMHIAADDKDYTMSVTKSLKKGMFSGKLGKITVSASQTKALAISPSSSDPPTIMATLKLRFDPSEPNAQPPRLGALTSKIRASTFYAIRAQKDLANRASMLQTYDITRGTYSTSIALPSRCVETVRWTYHAPTHPQALRRDSGYSTCSDDSSCSDTTITPSTQGWHEASVPIPLTLPACKTWLPTFHACLVSRIYSLEMALSVHTPGTGVPASVVTLRLPVQISSGPAAGDADADAELAAVVAAAEMDAEDYLRPRLIQAPGGEFVMGSSLPGREAPVGVEAPPPGYDVFAAPPRWAVVGSRTS